MLLLGDHLCWEGAGGAPSHRACLCPGRAVIWGRGSSANNCSVGVGVGVTNHPQVSSHLGMVCAVALLKKGITILGKGESISLGESCNISHVTNFCPLPPPPRPGPSSSFLAGCFNPRQEFFGMIVPLPQGRWPALEGCGALPRPLLPRVCAHLLEGPGPLFGPPVAACTPPCSCNKLLPSSGTCARAFGEQVLQGAPCPPDESSISGRARPGLERTVFRLRKQTGRPVISTSRC